MNENFVFPSRCCYPDLIYLFQAGNFRKLVPLPESAVWSQGPTPSPPGLGRLFKRALGFLSLTPHFGPRSVSPSLIVRCFGPCDFRLYLIPAHCPERRDPDPRSTTFGSSPWFSAPCCLFFDTTRNCSFSTPLLDGGVLISTAPLKRFSASLFFNRAPSVFLLLLSFAPLLSFLGDKGAKT